MHENGRNILASDDFSVDFFEASHPNGCLLFTFTEFSNRRLDGLGFGGNFAMNHGFDLIAFKSKADLWYKNLPNDIFWRIDAFLAELPRRHHFRAAYGSSMGGYAAILFAPRLRADAVLALSSQFDIAQAWDQRWVPHAQGAWPIPVLTSEMVRPNCRYFIAYDPTDLDRLHVERYSEIIGPSRIGLIKVPHGGHPVGYPLNAIGCLRDIALSVLSGEGVPAISDKLRAGRKTYSRYFLFVARRCLQKQKLKWARSLINRAIELAPMDFEIRIVSAQIHNAEGKLEAAIAEGALSVALAPRNPHVAANLATFLHRRGFHAQALHHIESAVALLPSSTVFLDQRAAIQRAGEAARVRG